MAKIHLDFLPVSHQESWFADNENYISYYNYDDDDDNSDNSDNDGSGNNDDDNVNDYDNNDSYSNNHKMVIKVIKMMIIVITIMIRQWILEYSNHST